MMDIIKQAYEMALTKPIGDRHLDSLYAEDQFYYLRLLYYTAKLMKTSVAVELGTCTGRGTAHLAAASGKVYTIDPELHGAFHKNTAPYNNIEFIQARSDDPTVLAKFADHSVDLCFVDSIHASDYCLKEVKLWTPKMNLNSIFLFDDLDIMKEVLPSLPFKNKGYLSGLHTLGFGFAYV